MARDNESFNRDLYDLLNVRGYDPVPLDDENKRAEASQASDVIQFNFKKDGEDYGKVWVTVDDSQNVIVYYDDEQQDSSSTRTPGVDYDDTWTGLLKFLKTWAQRRQLSFELKNKDRLGDDMRQRKYYKMKEKLGEGYHSMGKKASYNDAVPNVKIVLQHNRALEEGEQRYRNVDRIFLENADGERFLAPTNRPGIARVYARHIAEGGVPNDERWNHIKSVCEEYNKMAGFVRATRNKEFNESAQDLINEGANHYSNLRETLNKLTGHRGYQNYFESWSPPLMEDDSDDLSINELFVQETVDPRIESVMPILSKLRKNVAEMSEVDSLAEWADSIISEKLSMDSTTKSMAVPADKMLEAPGAETLSHNQSTEKSNLKAFGLAEEDQVDEGDIIKFPKGWVDITDKGNDEEDWNDDSWIPDLEDFEQEEEIRNRKRGPANDLEEMDKSPDSPKFDPARLGPGNAPAKPIKLGSQGFKDMDDIANSTFAKARADAKSRKGKDKGEVEEGLDKNQIDAGQLGPTEKVRNNNIGKLVGANESTEIDPELARIIEMARFKR